MKFPMRLTAVLSAFLVLGTPSAPLLAADNVPWLYKGSDVPPDPDWHFGTLANGLRYAVRPNGVPPGQVSIRVRVDAGSLNESDSEQGYAHLIEHLLFRQSKYLGDGQAITAWQRLGATFGSDTNAETSATQTVYKIDLPNATPTSLDESFKLLSGMVTAPTLSEANLKTDLPIVLAEMRERGGVSNRVADAMREDFYAGQRLADRAPIGTAASLHAATAKSVRAFYERWYRPENVVVIAAGGDDPAMLEKLIAKWFSGWKVPGPVTPAPSFGDPVAPAGADPANPVGSAHVMVEPDLPRGITYAVLRPWRQVHDTIVYNQGLMMDSLAQAIINRRLETRARAGASYLVAQVDQEKVSRSVDGTYVTVTPLTSDWRAALRDVRAVIAGALAKPPTKAEIAREVAELDVAFQVPVEQRSILPGSKLADDLVNALDIRETVAAPDDVLRIFRQSIPLFTPEAILEHTRKLFSGTVIRSLYVTPVPGEADAQSLKQALLAKPVPYSPPADAAKPISFDTLPRIGTPGTVTSDKRIGVLDIEEVTLSNGVRAMLWPVVEEPGRVMVKVRFGGGYRSLPSNAAPYIALGKMALVGSGEGTLGQDELDRISTGRKLGFDFDVGDAAFSLSAETRPSDLADQLYLFAAKLAMPRWDLNPFLRAKAATKLQYETYATSPQGVLTRDLDFFQHGRDPRYLTPTPREIDEATPEQFRRIWGQALDSGPVEVQIFGDFDKAKAIAALESTFGALKPRQPAPVIPAKPEADTTPPGEPIVLSHRGDRDQAAAVVSWPTGGGSIDESQGRQLEVLSQLFTNRLLEAVREKLGVAYAPYVFSTWPDAPGSVGSITALAQVKPADVKLFFKTAEDIAQDMVNRPPTVDELNLVLEPMRQRIFRATSSSAFFMQQLDGATTDPARIASIHTILSDYTHATPQQMQALAARYLVKGKDWRLAVLPQAEAGKEISAR